MNLKHLLAYIEHKPKFNLPLDSIRYDSITERDSWRLVYHIYDAIKEGYAKEYMKMYLYQKEPTITIEDGRIFLGEMENSLGGSEDDVYLDELKLILRPLSDLTKPIVVEGYNDGKEFVPSKSELLAKFEISVNKNFSFFDGIGSNDNIEDLPYFAVQLLLSWHFNVFNLPKCEWIDINTIK